MQATVNDEPGDTTVRAPWLRRFGRGLAVVLVGVAGALVALALMPAIGGEVGPGQVEMHLRTALDGRTVIGVPPLGQVHVDTHAAPTLVSAEVESVDIAALQDLLLSQRPTQRFIDTAERDAAALVRRVVLIAVGAGMLGGGIAGAVVWHRRWRRIAVTAVVGAVTVGALFGVTWQGYETNAFARPTYSGALQRAPTVVDAVSRHVQSFSEVQAQVDTLGHQLAELYAVAFAEPGPPSSEGTRILHVSDVHSNPLAMEIVGRLAEGFDVDAVLDTGDLTSFGLPVEARIADQIDTIDVPYLLVPGNHDSEQNRRAIGQNPNVEILDGEIAEVGDLEILGIADPTFTATNEIDHRQAEDIIADDADEAARIVRARAPHVLAVHNQILAQDSYGLVPLILNGHRHKREAEQRAGTLRLAVGSTGASGVGYFTVETDLPFEAQVLTFVDGCLRTQDYLRVHGIGGDVEIQRENRNLGPEPDARRPGCVSAQVRGLGEASEDDAGDDGARGGDATTEDGHSGARDGGGARDGERDGADGSDEDGATGPG